jgi:uncharacterized protein YbjT (DUF2867 family)
MGELSVVTGAFGYTGKYIAKRLLSKGYSVRTLTRRRPQFVDDRLTVSPLNFADREGLVNSLRGASLFFNTYWVRFSHGSVTFDQAVANTQRLIEAAVTAGVRRIVHISVTNASSTSPLPYFRGKGLTEEAVVRSGLAYAIIRPSLVFGPEDILVNNIAWILRRVPVFGVPGSGDYRVQPVSVEDVADLAVTAGFRTDNIVQDAVGPEVLSFKELIRVISAAIGRRARLISIPPAVAMLAAGLIGRFVDDVVLTSDELEGLMANLLVSDEPPTGWRRFSEWLDEYAERVGRTYAHELKRHYRSTARLQ